LIPRLSEFNWADSQNLITNGLAFSIAGILGSYFNHQLPIILVGISLSAQSTTNISIIMAIFMIFFGFINMLIIPFWPAISDSIALHDILWIKRSYKKLLIFSCFYSIVVFFILGFGGQILIQFWFDGMVKPDRILLLFYGIYFVLHAWEYINYMTLVGLNKIRIPSVLYAVRGLFVVVVCYFFVPVYGEVVVGVSLCLSIIIFTMLPLPYLYKQTLMSV
jgi:O-antigen/teichoic acid export membrane protein